MSTRVAKTERLRLDTGKNGSSDNDDGGGDSSSSSSASSANIGHGVDDLTPLPSPSLSPEGFTRIFKTFNGQPPPDHSQITRASSVRRPLMQRQQQRSISSIEREASTGVGHLGSTSIECLKTHQPQRPRISRSVSGESLPKSKAGQVFEAFDRNMNKSTWREMKTLGKGAFSTVVLASPAERLVKSEYQQHCRDKLVAIKLIDMTAAETTRGGARDRLEAGLKREVDILKIISHHSLIRLYAFNIDTSKALLVLPYCAGGDLYQLASSHRDELMRGDMVRRIMAELANAVEYLHEHWIVHRDIKLENILITPSLPQLLAIEDFTTYRKPVITLTDLGLSRRIDPDNPILETRCGSEDYVAPEIIMAQPYDGRKTDAWALGVVLYALLEGKLPFDPPPGRRAAHRIARVEWRWNNLKHAPEFDRAKEVVEGCLKRQDGRWSVANVLDSEWIRHLDLSHVQAHADEEISDMFIGC